MAHDDGPSMSVRGLWALAAVVFCGVSLITFGDTAGKLMTQFEIAPGFIAWSRFVIGVLVCLPFVTITRAEFMFLTDWRVLLRALFISSAVFCLVTALKTEPIANVMGAVFLGPIVSYLIAVIAMGERPSLRRGLLLAIGFIGVLIVVKPGFGVSVGMLFAIAAGLLHGAYLAMTRLVAGKMRPWLLLFSQLFVGAIVLAPVGAIALPTKIDLNLVILTLISAVGSAIGNLLLVIASKRAEASLVAPLVYTQLVTAAAVGVWVFGDWPDALSLLGLILIGASGLAALFTRSRTE